jgi:hypothetical protein
VLPRQSIQAQSCRFREQRDGANGITQHGRKAASVVGVLTPLVRRRVAEECLGSRIADPRGAHGRETTILQTIGKFAGQPTKRRRRPGPILQSIQGDTQPIAVGAIIRRHDQLAAQPWTVMPLANGPSSRTRCL